MFQALCEALEYSHEQLSCVPSTHGEPGQWVSRGLRPREVEGVTCHCPAGSARELLSPQAAMEHGSHPSASWGSTLDVFHEVFCVSRAASHVGRTATCQLTGLCLFSLFVEDAETLNTFVVDVGGLFPTLVCPVIGQQPHFASGDLPPLSSCQLSIHIHTRDSLPSLGLECVAQACHSALSPRATGPQSSVRGKHEASALSQSHQGEPQDSLWDCWDDAGFERGRCRILTSLLWSGVL